MLQDGPDEHLRLTEHWLIQCVMWTAGNGITFAEGMEDNTVTLDNSLAMNKNRPCQAVSASVLGCTPPRTQPTNRSLPFPQSSLLSVGTAPSPIRSVLDLPVILIIPFYFTFSYTMCCLSSTFDPLCWEHLACCITVWCLTQPVIFEIWLASAVQCYLLLICND